MKLFTVHFAFQREGKTVTRRVTVRATSKTVAEAMILAWLRVQRLTPFTITAEA
ncbi:hypothetical protein L4X63_22565 [Geomonas sp. Red32]|uniref:hypothetical protein n=1 Tax=Geomonas sp. Red32 TaxID=2912856 RepID=UPI00202CA953|nr:hypothetical protein [Geomonas sp. Red32]MCM0084373.1 hypothetical protein [Geomonas sp. Red32]